MPTLKEIKGRIASVQSTLKITSAMKLVSSAKLRKAQTAIEAMRPYQERLNAMLELAAGTVNTGGSAPSYTPAAFSPSMILPQQNPGPGRAPAGAFNPRSTVVIAMASNSSLCGGFNAQVIAKTKEVLRECPGARVIAIGRKMSDALRKSGAPAYTPSVLSPSSSVLSASSSVISSEAGGEVEKSPFSGESLSEHPSYAPVSAITDILMADSSVDCVLLVYNHFVSTGKQVPVVETLLSKEISPRASLGRNDKDVISSEVEKSEPFAILEPSRQELLDALYPKSVKIRFFAALLDSAAAEHAARTVAMQAATDNGEDLLQELTLQYNKGRQQKITNEILDLAGGSQTQ